MCVKLKNFEDYYGRLKAYCKNARIKVKIKELDCDAEWTPSTRTVSIDSDSEGGDVIAGFLHELGHSMDDVAFNGSSPSVTKAYNAYYKGEHTRTQWLLVLEHEKIAWRNAVTIANITEIPLGRWFHRYRKKCLGSYKE